MQVTGHFRRQHPMLYNALHITIKTAPSLAVFKQRLKILIYKSIKIYRLIYVIWFTLVMRLWVIMLSDIWHNINCLLYCIVLYCIIPNIIPNMMELNEVSQIKTFMSKNFVCRFSKLICDMFKKRHDNLFI